MLDQKRLVLIGVILAFIAVFAFLSAAFMTSDGGPIFLIYGLGFGMVLVMFIVNALSREERVKRERGWVVFALGLMAAIMVVATINRLSGVDGNSLQSTFPYMIIVAVSAIATVVAVRRRRRG